MTTLTPEELDLLEWLSREEYSQYGECHGRALTRLIKLGFAQIHAGRKYQTGFIVQGNRAMYRAVSLTEAGRRQLRGD